MEDKQLIRRMSVTSYARFEASIKFVELRSIMVESEESIKTNPSVVDFLYAYKAMI